MARYSGKVGYADTAETAPGVWKPVIKERKMKGDIIREYSNYQSSGQLNDDISLNHRVSLIGDAYAFDNYFNLKWIEVSGHKWKVKSVEIQRPRIIVTLGGVWNV